MAEKSISVDHTAGNPILTGFGARYIVTFDSVLACTLAEVFGAEDIDADFVDSRLWEFLVRNGVRIDEHQPGTPSPASTMPKLVDQEPAFETGSFNADDVDLVNFEPVGNRSIREVFGEGPATWADLRNQLWLLIGGSSLQRRAKRP